MSEASRLDRDVGGPIEHLKINLGFTLTDYGYETTVQNWIAYQEASRVPDVNLNPRRSPGLEKRGRLFALAVGTVFYEE